METDTIKIRVYTALLYQTSTDPPIATVLQNTTGYNWTWARTSLGAYTATPDLNTEPVVLNTILTTAEIFNNLLLDGMYTAYAATDAIYISTAQWLYPTPGWAQRDGMLIFTKVKIEIYIKQPLTII